MDPLSIGAGVVVAGVIYVLYLAATKGVPAAIAKVKAVWSAGKTELATLRNDLAQLEQGAVADIKQRLSKLEAAAGTASSAPKPVAAAAAPAPGNTAPAAAAPNPALAAAAPLTAGSAGAAPQ